MNNKQLGQRIAELRKQNNLSQKELANKLCVSNKTISKWECGNSLPDFETMQKLAIIFSISLDSFSKTEKIATEQEENKQKISKLDKKKVIMISCILPFCIVVILMTLLCYFLVPRAPNIQESSLFTINKEQTELYCSVDNNKEILTLSNTLELPRNNKWKLYYDINGMIEISSKTVNLQVGDNVFYIVVENTAGETKTYKTIIRRKPLYVVTFNTNGGAPITQQIVMEYNFAKFETPTREGYIFNSWDYDFSKPITSNITITASWIPKNLKITYFANNGTESSTIQNVTYDTQVNLKTENEFTQKGYSLSSWNTKSDGSGESFATNKSYTKYNITEDLTLFAQWTINQYNIIVTPNLEAAGIVNGQGRFDYNSTRTLTVFTNEGYTWDGWYSVDGVFLSKSQSLQLTLEDKDVEVCARWMANKYNICLNVNGGNSISLESKELTFGEDFTLPIATRIEAIFLGWFDDKNTQYTNANGTSLISWDIANNITLYAHYKINEYQVDLNKNIETAGSVNGNGLKEYGSTVKLSAQTNEGYSFVGWYLGTEQMTTNTTYSFIMPNYPITYIAKWKANDYTLIMDVNGGVEFATNNQTIVFNTTFTLPTTTKNGYTFGGWYLGTNGTGTQITDNNGNSLNVWNIADNKTIYAKWNLINYSITYSLNEGTVVTANPITYTIEDLDIKINNPIRNGYIFEGWIGTDIVEKTKNLTIPAGSFGNKKYAAVWSISSSFIAISSPTDLLNISNDLSGYYYLTQNIDLEGYDFTGIGDENNYFSGIFEGNGYSILNINGTSTNKYTGLFNYSNGIINNLKIEFNADINNSNVGGLVGYNIGKIENCKAIVNIIGRGLSGGLVAYNSGIIKNSYTTGTVKAICATTYKNSVIAGGLVAENIGEIISCYSNCFVTANEDQQTSGSIFAGGLVGSNKQNGIIKSSFATGDVNALGSMRPLQVIAGGLVAYNYQAIVEKSYRLSTQQVTSTQYGSEGKINESGTVTTENNIQSLNVLSWGIFVSISDNLFNNNNVWIVVDNSYPKLYWEI